MPEQQRGAELEHGGRRGLLGPRRSVAELRTCLLQLGQPVCPVASVEGGGTVHDLQGEPQGWGQQPGAERERLGREALGLGCLGAQQRGVGEHRRCGGRPRRALPAVSGGRGERLVAQRQHGAHVTRGAGDDAQQHQALHRQVVEAVAAAQIQRRFELGVSPGPVVALEQRGAPGQAGERLQVRFGRQLVDRVVSTNVDVPSPCRGGQLLGHRPQDDQVGGVVARPVLPRVAQVSPRGRQVADLELGECRDQGQPRVGRGGLGAQAGERAAQRQRGLR